MLSTTAKELTHKNNNTNTQDLY